QFADCMSAVTPDQQSMQCCGSMPCHQGNQHACCRSAQHASAVLPAAPLSSHLAKQAAFAPNLAIAPALPNVAINLLPHIPPSSASPPSSSLGHPFVLRI